MTSSSEVGIPEPMAADPELVVTALQAAAALGKKGDLGEAVRWLRRAVESASDSGLDARAFELAGAVAGLNERLQPRPSQPGSNRSLPPPLPRNSAPAPPSRRSNPSPPSAAAPNAAAAPNVAPIPRTLPLRQAVRVAVQKIEGQSEGFHVKLLEDGHPVPPGTQEALLVVLSPDANLFSF